MELAADACRVDLQAREVELLLRACRKYRASIPSYLQSVQPELALVSELLLKLEMLIEPPANAEAPEPAEAPAAETRNPR